MRRLPLKLYFGLPNTKCRTRILRLFLKDDDLNREVDINGLALMTEKYSCSDLKSPYAHAALVWRVEETRRDTQPGSVSATPPAISQGPKKLRLTVEHFVKALDRVRPNDAESLAQNLEDFSRKYNPGALRSDEVSSLRS